MLLFALMNSAPAELLHPLNDAALQPYWLRRQREYAMSVAKKNAGYYAGAGILAIETKSFFNEKAALPDSVGVSGKNRKDRFGLLLSIKFDYSLSVLAVLYLPSATAYRPSPPRRRLRRKYFRPIPNSARRLFDTQ